MKPIVTLVVLADESLARFLENRGIGKGLTQMSAISAVDYPDADAEFSDFPGRSRAAPGVAAHAVDRTTSERRHRRESFARHVMDATEGHWERGDYDRFGIAAAPGMLGALRDLLGGVLAETLVFDFAKNLIKIPQDELPKYFEDQVVY